MRLSLSLVKLSCLVLTMSCLWLLVVVVPPALERARDMKYANEADTPLDLVNIPEEVQMQPHIFALVRFLSLARLYLSLS